MFPIIAMLVVVVMGSCKKDNDPGIPPKVTSTAPITNATGTAVTSKITATFDVAMDASTITAATFFVRLGSAPVAGAVTYSGTTATFTPASSMTANTLYTATITTGAKNVAGTSLTKDYVWTFTTGAAPDTTAPTVTLTAPLRSTETQHPRAFQASSPLESTHTFPRRPNLISPQVQPRE